MSEERKSWCIAILSTSHLEVTIHYSLLVHVTESEGYLDGELCDNLGIKAMNGRVLERARGGGEIMSF